MRRLVRLGFALGIVSAALFLLPRPAGACSCATATDAEYLGYADVVFEGIVTDRAEPTPSTMPDGTVVYSSEDPITWTVDVDRVLKGTAADPQPVKSSRDGASCGTGFDLGKRYRIYATRAGDGALTTGLCSGNREVAASVVTTTTIRPTTLPPSTTAATAATTTNAPSTTLSSAIALEPASDNEGRGGLALVAAAGVLGVGAAAVLIRRLR